jgi:hypothetical protein
MGARSFTVQCSTPEDVAVVRREIRHVEEILHVLIAYTEEDGVFTAQLG